MDARPTIPYVNLPELPPGHVLSHEWRTYRGELPRLLEEGNEGKFALIKGDEILGLYDSWDRARAEGLRRFLLEPHMVKQILSQEPLLRLRGVA